MPTIDFKTGTTITEGWLNDIDAFVYEDLPNTSNTAKGDALIGVKRTATGATATTLHNWIEGQVLNVKTDFGAVGDGVTNDRTAFANALAAAPSGSVITGPRATYYFSITGDSDTLLPLSNTHLIFPKGTVFLWGYMGSPLICISEKTDVSIEGITFEWNGVLADVAGSSNSRFNWAWTLPNRDFCAHILSLGSSRVRVSRCASRTNGDNPTLATQCFYQFASFHHSDNGTTRSVGNSVEDCQIDDIVIGSLLSGQDNFTFKSITSRRFPGDHPVGGGSGLAGHLIYTTDNSGTLSCRNILVNNIADLGTPVGTTAARNDTSVQLKQVTGGCISNVVSNRSTGLFSGAEIKNLAATNMVWQPPSCDNNGMSISLLNGVGMQDSVMKALSFILPDSVDKSAWNMTSLSRCDIEAFISASHTTASQASSVLTTGLDNRVSIAYLARNSTTAQAVNFSTNSLRNYVKITPVGQNHALRPFVGSGSTDNVVRIEDNVLNAWSNSTWWTTESDSPALGFDGIKKSKVYRIGTTTNPTTTFQLPRAGIYTGTVQIIESTGAHLLGGLYRIAWDTGTLQGVELIGTQWTKGASAPTVLNLAVSNAGVVTVTTTAGNQAWDIVYDFQSLGNNRYADY